ncbi:MAG TPA: hypothetical protein VKQ52_17950, partial [Puia sp.]|nr:hypothetical protein [Puia sp.]
GAELPGPDKSVSQLSVKNGRYYFFATQNNILKQTSDFATYTVISPPLSGPGDNAGIIKYFVTNDNHFILSTGLRGLYYQTP